MSKKNTPPEDHESLSDIKQTLVIVLILAVTVLILSSVILGVIYWSQ